MSSRADKAAAVTRRGAKPGPKTGTTPQPTTITRDSGADNAIPDLPDPAIYGLQSLNRETFESEPVTEWPEACQRAWRMIWTSELAGNFVESDRLAAESALLFLAQAVDPTVPDAQRRAANKEYSAALDKIGLNPSARSRLKISIATEEQTERKNDRDKRREAPQPADTAEQPADHNAEIVDLYSRNTGTGPGGW